jgi:hypothetical protein
VRALRDEVGWGGVLIRLGPFIERVPEGQAPRLVRMSGVEEDNSATTSRTERRATPPGAAS